MSAKEQESVSCDVNESAREQVKVDIEVAVETQNEDDLYR